MPDEQRPELTEHEVTMLRSVIHKKLNELNEEELLFHLQCCDSWIIRKKSKRNISGLTQWETEMLEKIENHRLKVLERIPIR